MVVFSHASFVFAVFSADILQVPARAAAVLHGRQLHVDVLRGIALAHGPGGGVRQRRVRDALVLRHRLGLAGRTHGRVRFVEELFRGHGAVSVPPAQTYETARLLTEFVIPVQYFFKTATVSSSQRPSNTYLRRYHDVQPCTKHGAFRRGIYDFTDFDLVVQRIER